jgi:uncharacterized RDD family membrane protein YckC
MLDTLTQVETPEGVTLPLRPAGVVPRAAAWFIDAFIRMCLFGAVSAVIGLLGAAGAGIVFLEMFLIYWFYMVLFEGLNQGRTPGKMVLGLRVINDNGLPVGWIPSLLRNLLRTVDMFPMLYGFGLVSMLLDDDSRRLGDRVAGTLVVHERAPLKGGFPKDVVPVRPPGPLSTAEQITLLNFAERSGYLTPARQMELADILEPLSGLTGPKAVKRLLGYAGFIAGRG